MVSRAVIRDATAADAAACARIYAPYVTDTCISFELEPPVAPEMGRRIAASQEAHVWLVAQIGEEVVGYAYATRHRERAAYRFACDVSVYLDQDCTGRGLGRDLYTALFERLAAQGYRMACAGITLPNPASERLHRAMGFEPVGTYQRIGWKQERWHDVLWLQRSLGADVGGSGHAIPLDRNETPGNAVDCSPHTGRMDRTPFSTKPTLRGELVTLRPIRAEDADLIDALIREDDEIARLTGSVHSSIEEPAGMPIEDLREIYGRWAQADDRLVLAVLDNANGQLVGEVVLNDWDEGNRSCGFRTLIGRAGRGRGLGTEATRLIVDHGLTTMGMHRISLEVYDFNPRARHVYEKVGFVHEGTGREALLFDGEWIDVHYLAILAP